MTLILMMNVNQYFYLSYCYCRDFEEKALSPKTVMLKQKKRTKPQLYERRQHEVTNLLSPHVVESGSLSLRGWWMSHVKWEVIDLKRKSRPNVKQVSLHSFSSCNHYQFAYFLIVWRAMTSQTKWRLLCDLVPKVFGERWLVLVINSFDNTKLPCYTVDPALQFL